MTRAWHRRRPPSNHCPRVYLVLLSLLFPLLSGGCNGCDEPRHPPLMGALPKRAGDIDPLGKAKRPGRRYYVDNHGGKCAVYWLDGNRRSIQRSVKCPREIDPGEQLWLSSRVCFRHSDDISRRVQVRCPPAIIRADTSDRADAGEYTLPEAPRDAGRAP